MDTESRSSGPLLSTYSLPATDLPNRVVMAPMTRLRADLRGVPTEIMADYYAQRAGAGLIVSEGIAPSVRGQQYLNEPGLFTEEQVAAWQRVTAAVHAAGGRIFAQLMHSGRNGHPVNRLDGGWPEAPSPVALTGHLHTVDAKVAPVRPRAMTPAGIRDTVAEHARAARNAVRAGFDGVEIHGANSYLVHQFLADNTNLRTDRYGGPAANRIRFAVEVTEAVADAVGAGRVGLRLSPGNPENEMAEADPAPVYRRLLAALDPLGLAFLHLTDDPEYPALEDLRPRWSGTLVGNTGEHEQTTPESAARLLREGRADLVSVGRPYIANPDLVERIAAGAPWAAAPSHSHYDRGAAGYTDFPVHAGSRTAAAAVPAAV